MEVGMCKLTPEPTIIVPDEKEIISLGCSIEKDDTIIYDAKIDQFLKSMGGNALAVFADPSRKNEQLHALRKLAHAIWVDNQFTVPNPEKVVEQIYESFEDNLPLYSPQLGCPIAFFQPIALSRLKNLHLNRSIWVPNEKTNRICVK